MKDRDFKGVWIPKEIWNMNMQLSDKLYLGIYKTTNDINETDKIMGYTMSKSSILRIKQRLADLGYIKYIDDPEQAKQFVIDMLDEGDTCDWCGRKNYVLHEHHYPVSKSKGGVDTVRICPNCHANFHYVFKEDNNAR